LAKIVAIGGRGTGKSNFVALVAVYSVELGETSSLLVDTNPDQNLGEMVRSDVEKESNRFITELL
jgi:CO dehydrogenase nickel-insertion accessory protein CooC1